MNQRSNCANKKNILNINAPDILSAKIKLLSQPSFIKASSCNCNSFYWVIGLTYPTNFGIYYHLLLKSMENEIMFVDMEI